MEDIAKLFIYIELGGEGLVLEQIKKLWKDNDVFFSPKGDIYYEFKSCEKIEKHREENYCNIRFETKQKANSLSEILEVFLNEQMDNIKECQKNVKKIHICIYPEKEQYTFDISENLMKMLLESNLKIGITVLQL